MFSKAQKVDLDTYSLDVFAWSDKSNLIDGQHAYCKATSGSQWKSS